MPPVCTKVWKKRRWATTPFPTTPHLAQRMYAAAPKVRGRSCRWQRCICRGESGRGNCGVDRLGACHLTRSPAAAQHAVEPRADVHPLSLHVRLLCLDAVPAAWFLSVSLLHSPLRRPQCVWLPAAAAEAAAASARPRLDQARIDLEGHKIFSDKGLT